MSPVPGGGRLTIACCLMLTQLLFPCPLEDGEYKTKKLAVLDTKTRLEDYF